MKPFGPLEYFSVWFMLMLSLFLGLAVGDCISRPAHAGTTNGGISSSAERMATALERIADVLEKKR